MMGLYGFCLLAILLITNFEAVTGAISYPLEGCSPVKKLDGTEVTGATLTGPAATTGPYNYEALALPNSNSGLEIPQNASGLGDTIRTIAFNIKLNSYNQNKVLFTILSSAGKGLVVRNTGEELIMTTNFPTGTVAGAVASVITTYNKTQLANNWNAIKLTVNLGEGIFIQNQYGAGLNGAIVKDETNRYEDFSNGNIVVNSFDGGLCCMTLSDQTDGTASLLTSTACTNHASTCPATTTTTAATTTATTTTAATTTAATTTAATTTTAAATTTTEPISVGEIRTDPIVDPVPLCICDVEEPSLCHCQPLIFTGYGFAQGDTYVCNIRYHELNAAGQLVATTNASIPAVFVNEEEVTCTLPKTVSAEVTLFWAKRALALATAKVIFVPELCFDCFDDFSCQATGAGCVIGGECVPPYIYIDENFNQTCVPDLSAVGPSPIPSIRGKLKSCGEVKGFKVNETQSGFVTDELALAAASFAINFKFIARLPCSTNERVTLAALAPGIKIYQLGSKVTMELAFVDPVTGAENVVSKEFDVNKENSKSIFNLLQKKLRRRKKNVSREFCGVGLFLRHIPATGETSLTDLKKKKIEFGDTKNLQIFTTGQAMISKEVRACFQINNSPKKSHKYTKKSGGCYRHVWRTKESCGKRKKTSSVTSF